MLAVNVVYELVCDLFAGFVFKIDSLYAEVLWFGGMLAGIMNTDAHSWYSCLDLQVLMH